MTQMLLKFALDDSGQDLIEYGLLAMFIALSVTVALTALGTALNQYYSDVSNSLP